MPDQRESEEVRRLRMERAAINEQRELQTEQLRARHGAVRQVLETALDALGRLERLDEEMRAELVTTTQMADQAVPEQLDYTIAHLEQAERGAISIPTTGTGVLEEATRVGNELRAAAESTENIGLMVRVAELAREAGLIE